ncbi:hypothetical protein GGR56DRAFT_248853 [Xylariaceae sp. FL0804]|nr:hypothetical protein GGR56DRAFT_248853 [Xylariaceae sp. FL0804]
MQDLRPLAYGLITTLFVITTITCFMRIYVRKVTMRAFGWDDTALAAVMVFNCCQQAILYFFLHYGAGQHIGAIMATHPEWLTIITKGLLAEEFWYIWMQFTVKMCFLLFYFRLSKTEAFLRALWAVIAFHCVTTVVIWLLYALQCMPLAAFWDPTKYPNTTCLSSNVTYWVPFTLNLTTDLCILALPLTVVWSLQMTWRRRLTILAVVTTGGSAVLVSALRGIVLAQFSSSPDFTWTLGEMVIISNVEMQVGLFAANMPALKAFYSCWRRGALGPGQGTEAALMSRPVEQRYKGSKSSRSTQSGHELESGLSRHTDVKMTSHTGDRQQWLKLRDSEEELVSEGAQGGGAWESNTEAPRYKLQQGNMVTVRKASD